MRDGRLTHPSVSSLKPSHLLNAGIVVEKAPQLTTADRTQSNLWDLAVQKPHARMRQTLATTKTFCDTPSLYESSNEKPTASPKGKRAVGCSKRSCEQYSRMGRKQTETTATVLKGPTPRSSLSTLSGCTPLKAMNNDWKHGETLQSIKLYQLST